MAKISISVTEIRLMKIAENTKERGKENILIRKTCVSKTDIRYISCRD